MFQVKVQLYHLEENRNKLVEKYLIFLGHIKSQYNMGGKKKHKPKTSFNIVLNIKQR